MSDELRAMWEDIRRLHGDNTGSAMPDYNELMALHMRDNPPRGGGGGSGGGNNGTAAASPRRLRTRSGRPRRAALRMCGLQRRRPAVDMSRLRAASASSR